jgi:SagB-type dehydrogenase family enzyme
MASKSQLSRLTALDQAMQHVLTGHRAGNLDLSGRRARIRPEQWPSDWTTVEYKEYPRFGPTMRISASEAPSTPLVSVLGRRRTQSQFRASSVPGSEFLAAFQLAAAERTKQNASRPYPSAGARYPLELYVLASHVSGMLQGVYHFRPRERDFVLLFADRQVATHASHIHGQSSLGTPAAFVALTVSLRRSATKYGARGYRFALLEAGAAAYALDLAFTSLGYGVAWVGGFDDSQLASALGLSVDQELEFPALMLAVGGSLGRGRR